MNQQVNNNLTKLKQMNRMHSHQQINKNVVQMKKSTSLEYISNSLSHMQYLVSILKCPLCNQQVKQAHMCPTCCKLYCQICIKNWIVYKKPQCPNCAKPLRYTSPINCQGLAKQIQQAITKTATEINTQSKQYQSPYESKALSGVFSTPDLYTEQSRISLISTGSENQRNLCPQHELKLQYYCETCCVGVCSDCAVLSNKHQGHKLCKYSHKRLKFQEKLNLIIKSMATFKKQLIKKREQKQQIIQNIHRIQQQKSQISKLYLKRIHESIVNKLNFMIQSKSQLHTLMKQKLVGLNLQVSKIQTLMQSQKKTNLINKGIEYSNQIRRSMQNQLNIMHFKKQNIQNQFIPSFGSKTFILDNYTYLKQKKDLLYSEALFWKGIQWKLRIFPGGIQESNPTKQGQNYLAIYLQMSKGHRQPNIYKYEILLINQVDRSKAIGCAFENQFEEGTYWGLDRFANISFLQSQKFIHPVHGYLQIVLNVKSPTYFHAVKDENFLIQQKLSFYKQNHQKLKKLRKSAGAKILDIRSNRKLAITKIVQSLIDTNKVQGSQNKIRRRRKSFG